MKISRLQITPTDGEMDVFERTDGFQFDDDPVFNEKIETVFADLMILVEKRNRFLTNELNPTQSNLDSERLLINGFEETWPEFAVNPDSRCDDVLGRLTIPQIPSCFPAFLIHHQIVPAVAVSSQPGLRGSGAVVIFS